MIAAFLVILGCQLAGEGLSHGLHLPVPGPVLGMVLLTAGFIISPRLVAMIRPAAQGVLGILLLLFVPAGVGAAGQFMVLGERMVPVLIAIAVSTVLAIIAGALTFAFVARLTGNFDDEDMPPLGPAGAGKEGRP